MEDENLKFKQQQFQIKHIGGGANMTTKISIRIFDDKEVRAVWDETTPNGGLAREKRTGNWVVSLPG